MLSSVCTNYIHFYVICTMINNALTINSERLAHVAYNIHTIIYIYIYIWNKLSIKNKLIKPIALTYMPVAVNTISLYSVSNNVRKVCWTREYVAGWTASLSSCGTCQRTSVIGAIEHTRGRACVRAGSLVRTKSLLFVNRTCDTLDRTVDERNVTDTCEVRLRQRDFALTAFFTRFAYFYAINFPRNFYLRHVNPRLLRLKWFQDDPSYVPLQSYKYLSAKCAGENVHVAFSLECTEKGEECNLICADTREKENENYPLDTQFQEKKIISYYLQNSYGCSKLE